MTVFQRGNELAGFKEAFMGPGVEPGVAAAHDLNRELSLFEIKTIQVGNLQFSSRRRLEALGKRNDMPVVERFAWT